MGDGSGEGEGGRDLEREVSCEFLGGFRGVGDRWGTTKRFARELEDLRSFWDRNDRPVLGTITNQKWPYGPLELPWPFTGPYCALKAHVFLEGKRKARLAGPSRAVSVFL